MTTKEEKRQKTKKEKNEGQENRRTLTIPTTLRLALAVSLLRLHNQVSLKHSV